MATSVAGSAAVLVPAAADAVPGTPQVRAAIRLGWFIAEVRGRYWWRGQHPPVVQVPVDPPEALPLRPERTSAESRGAARAAAAHLATQLGVAARPADPDGPSFPQDLQRLAGSLERDGGRLLQPAGSGVPRTEAALRDAAWKEMAHLLHEWDSAIQDALTARADVLANGYLLGRGLAECYWAMAAETEASPDPDAAGEGPAAPRTEARGGAAVGAAVAEAVDEAVVGEATVPATDGPEGTASSWEFLLGAPRRAELSRLVGRVAPHLPALTPTAVAGSLQVWGEVAVDPTWRALDGVTRLHEQYRRWYELVVLGREPTTYVRPYALLHGWRTTLRAFRGFWPQLLLATVSAALVTAVAYFLGTGQGTAWVTSVLAFLGTVGLTASGIAAKAKSAGQQLVARLRQDAYSDLVAVAVTVVPQPSGNQDKPDRATERRMRKAIRQRHITPVTPAPDDCAPS